MSEFSQEPIPWNPAGPRREEIRTLVARLWLEGKTATEIRPYFSNASRNAIIGIVHRMKLTDASRQKAIRDPKQPKTPRIPDKPRRSNVRYSAMTAPKPSPAAEPGDVDIELGGKTDRLINELRQPIVGTTPITILDLPNRPTIVCRFPVQGPVPGLHYCGQPSGDETYCRTHRKLAYSAVKAKHLGELPRRASGHLPDIK